MTIHLLNDADVAALQRAIRWHRNLAGAGVFASEDGAVIDPPRPVGAEPTSPRGIERLAVWEVPSGEDYVVCTPAKIAGGSLTAPGDVQSARIKVAKAEGKSYAKDDQVYAAPVEFGIARESGGSWSKLTDAGGKPLTWADIDAIVDGGVGTGVLRPVDLTLETGSPGDFNTTCTFTYSAIDRLNSTDYGGGLSPEMARIPKSPMNSATVGLGYINDQGDFVLFWCDEVPSTEVVELTVDRFFDTSDGTFKKETKNIRVLAAQEGTNGPTSYITETTAC